MRSKFSNVRRLIFLGGGLSLAIVAALLFSLASTSKGSESSVMDAGQIAEGQAAQQDKTVQQKDFGAWSYQVTEGVAGKTLHISSSDASVNDIQAYIAANRALLPQVIKLGGQVEVVITFVPTLSPDTFRAWAKAKGIQGTFVELRTSAPGSTGRGTISVAVTADDPLPQDRLAPH